MVDVEPDEVNIFARNLSQEILEETNDEELTRAVAVSEANREYPAVSHTG